MKKVTLLLLVLLLCYLHKSQSQTLTFTSYPGVVWNDGIAEDGEGGSANISAMTIQIYNVDDALSNLGKMEWYSNLDLSTADGFSGLTTFLAAGDGSYKGQIIKESSGLEFQINGFQWYDWGNNNNQPMTVIGFRDGDQVASTTFTGNGSPNRVFVSLNSDFDNVDEVRILTTTGTTYPSINNIEIDNPVLDIANSIKENFQIISKNKEFASNKNNVTFEVYNLLGKKVKNDNLPYGVYIVKATMNNEKTVIVKRYL